MEITFFMRRKYTPKESVELALRELKAGKIIVTYDPKEGGGEGDATILGKYVTPQNISDLIEIAHGGGRLCISMRGSDLEEMNIPLQSEQKANFRAPNMHVEVDSIRSVTGITGYDYAYTIEDLINKKREKIVKEGHTIPLSANPDGLYGRGGHTEAVYHLNELAEVKPIGGVIMEITRKNKDGVIDRVQGDALLRLARHKGLHIVTIPEILEYSQLVGYRPNQNGGSKKQ
jgi:3,4-dihydroxy-2-butanone 4-phosphate synthase